MAICTALLSEPVEASLIGRATNPTGLAVAEAGDPANPDLIYDYETGEVLLDLDGAPAFLGYVLNTDQGFIASNHTPFLNGTLTSLWFELAEGSPYLPGSSPPPNIRPFPKSIGFVFPTGMNQAALSDFITGNQVAVGISMPTRSFDLIALNVPPPPPVIEPAVPEPSTYAMAASALVGLGLLAHHRRRTTKQEN